MTDLLLHIVEHPYESIAIFLSLCAGGAVLMFMGGFFPGFRQLTHIDMNDEHLQHTRTRTVWAVTLLTFLFLVWETTRSIANLFYGTGSVSTLYVLLGIWALLIGLYFLVFKKPIEKAKH